MTDEQIITDVTRRMMAFVAPFVCPISYEEEEQVRLRGTGNFIALFGRRVLLTCDHVVQGAANLAFRQIGTNEPLRADILKFAQLGYPIDAAAALLPDPLWAAVGHTADVIPEDRFALTHHATENELMFFRGYARENSVFAFETLASNSTSYTTQVIKDLPPSDPLYFFHLHHQPEKVTFINEKVRFEYPSGFSGALVWNTRFVQCAREKNVWSPEMAQVAGLVCRWRPDDPGIMVLRVEHLRSFLLRTIDDMRADGDL